MAVNMRLSPDWTPEAFSRWKNDDDGDGKYLDEVEFMIPPLLVHHQLDIINNDKVIEFHHSGGHTSCSVYGYYPAERVLFVGDLIFSGMFPFAGDPGCDPEKWIKTLKLWLTMDIEKVVAGHGPVTDIQEVKKQLGFFEHLKQNTLEAIKSGRVPSEIALPTVYPIEEKTRWLAEKTQNRWHEYYLNMK